MKGTKIHGLIIKLKKLEQPNAIKGNKRNILIEIRDKSNKLKPTK